jgi:hypothetical protein
LPAAPWRRAQDLVVENVRRFLAGGTAALRNQVDVVAGY